MREIDRLQFRVPVEAEAADHQRLELPGEKIGEIEGAGVRLGQRRECGSTGEGRIAMRPRQPLDPFRLQHRIESPAGAAIGIGHIDPGINRAGFVDRVADRPGDQLGPVVQGRRQTAQFDMREAIGLDEGHDLPGKRPTSDDQRALHGKVVLVDRRIGASLDIAGDRFGWDGRDRDGQGRGMGQSAGRRQASTRSWLCFRAMKRWAVSTATEASRQ